MTITALYTPAEHTVNSAREYSFSFPAVDDRSVEVWEIFTTGGVSYRYLVPPQYYTIQWAAGKPKYPIKPSGVIKFTRRHTENTSKVRIVRNTLIAQLMDFPPLSDFNGRMMEFVLDKATMICQEIGERKCEASTTTPMTQLVSYTAYDQFKSGEVNFAVAKLFDILEQIVASATNCEDNLEDT